MAVLQATSIKPRLNEASLSLANARRTRGRVDPGEFELDSFFQNTVKPLLLELKEEISESLSLSNDALIGLCQLDPTVTPDNNAIDTDMEFPLTMDSGIQSEAVSACSSSDEAQAVLPGSLSATPDEQYLKLIEFYSNTQIQGKDLSYPLISKAQALGEFTNAKKTMLDLKSTFDNKKEMKIRKQKEKMLSYKKKLQSLNDDHTFERVKRKAKLRREIEECEETIQQLHKQEYNLSQLLLDWVSNEELVYSFKETTKLIQLAGIVPASAAPVESAWSLLGLLCTPLRSSALQGTLRKIMRISLSNDLIDYHHVLKYWLAQKKRRVSVNISPSESVSSGDEILAESLSVSRE